MDWYTNGIAMVPPVEGPILLKESGWHRVAHLRHKEVDIRPPLLNPKMNGLFASSRIALNDTRIHLGREAHRNMAFEYGA